MIEGILVFLVMMVGMASCSLGVISLYRFPDVYTRLHGATKCTTFGTIFTSFAVFVYAIIRYLSTGNWRFMELFIHGAIAVVVMMITNATSSHAIARAAWHSGTRPEPCVVDALEEHEHQEKIGGAAA